MVETFHGMTINQKHNILKNLLYKLPLEKTSFSLYFTLMCTSIL